MKIAVSTYSFGEYIKPENLGFFGVMEKAREMGFDGLEISENEYTDDLSMMELVGNTSKKTGFPIVALDVSADFSKNNFNDIDAEVQRLKGLVDTASLLGAPMMRHDACYGKFGKFGRKPGTGFDDVLPYIADGCRKVAEYAASKGIKTMVENHGLFVQDSPRLEKLFNAVNHPNFGILCDIGNFMCADEDPGTAVGNIAGYTCHVHAKDFHYKSGDVGYPGEGWFVTRGGNYLRGAVIGHGDAKVRRSIDLLKRSGYDGYVTLEFEGIEDNITGIRLGFDNLKRYIG